MIANIYFYNNSKFLSNKEFEEIKNIVEDKWSQYFETLKDYEVWKNMIKNYNQFIPVKHRRKDYSRYAWHKETERANNKYNNISTKEDYIQSAYNDSFYKNNELFYPVNYPQIFKLQLGVNNLSKIFESESEIINYLENISEKCILGSDETYTPNWKEISNNIGKFYNEYPNGVIMLYGNQITK